MSDVTWSVSFGGLTFTDTDAHYRLVDAQPSKVKWRRGELTMPFIAGNVVTSEVQDVDSYQVIVRLIGDGSTNAGTLLNNVKTAGAATTTLAVTLAGASETYKARPPDISAEASFEWLLNNQRVVTLVFQTQPYPT